MKHDTLTRALALCLLALALAGCGKQGPGGEIWKEEVRLMNGDLIIVDRVNVWEGTGDLSKGHGPLTKVEIRFDYKGRRYEWVQRGLAPTALQEDPQGRMYIVSLLPYCWAWRDWGKPKSYYVVHRYEEGGWQRIDVSAVDPDTVFNLASKSSEPRSTRTRDYVPETATKYSTNIAVGEPNRRIVPGEGAGCQ